MMQHLGVCFRMIYEHDSVHGNDDDSGRRFEPNPRILKRVMAVLMNDAIGRTRLAQAANVHYYMLMKHLVWLEQKRYIEFAEIEDKTLVRLTLEGRAFVSRLADLYT